MLDLRYGAAGRSAQRRYDDLERSWRRRTFGARSAIYFWAFFGALLLLVISRHPGTTWALIAGIFFGGALGVWSLLPTAVLPGHIFNGQRGAWGEQMTARELHRLQSQGWLVRYDLRWGTKGNHDHIVAGGAVFVVNSKNVKDSTVSLESGLVRVTHLDGSDSYIADRWAPTASAEARSLRRELSEALRFPVHVYPVVAIWGSFASEAEWLMDVAFVRGDRLCDWLTSRPDDLLTDEKRTAVAAAVAALPRA